MPYRVSFDEGDGIIHVTFSGSVVKDDYRAAFDAAFRLYQEYACSKLLVDFSGLSGSGLSTAETFSFGEAVAKTPGSLKIAHVLPLHAKACENVLFVSIVESNLGKTTANFETVEEARNWLLGQ